jgi:4-hydroxy-3-methylbut-2-en-1-yl diphosphate reductase
MTDAPVVCTPLRSERAALWHAVSAPVMRTGMGPSRRVEASGPVLVAGVAGALIDQLRPGDLVVADELRTADTTAPSHAAALLFGAVRRQGLRVHLGPLLSQERLAYGPHLAAAAPAGALAVDMESAYLAGQAPAGQTVALRAIVDTPTAPLMRPGTLWRGVKALRALRAAAHAIDQWAAAVGDRDVLLAGPLSVRALAERSDLVLVAGSRAVMEAAETYGKATYLVDSADAVDLRWLVGVRRLGIVSDASSPSHLVDDLVRCLSGLGSVVLTPLNDTAES